MTAGQGINAIGDMVGFYTADATGLPPSHGYLFARGAFLTIDVPGAMDTACRGINSRGDIVGEYDLDGITEHGYLRRGNSFTTIDFPGAANTAWIMAWDSHFPDNAGSYAVMSPPQTKPNLPDLLHLQ